jgi:hypothetical protein
MLSSTKGLFRAPDDFEAAMRDDGCAGLIVTQRGPFRARLTRIALHRLHLQSAEESSARVAFFAISAGSTLVFIPIDHSLPPIWDGASTCAGGSSRCLAVTGLTPDRPQGAAGKPYLLPTRILESHAETLTGSSLVLPLGVSMWRPSITLYRQLIRLHMSATGVARTRASLLTTSEPARSLEQELMGAVIACLLEGDPVPRRRARATRRRHGAIRGPSCGPADPFMHACGTARGAGSGRAPPSHMLRRASGNGPKYLYTLTPHATRTQGAGSRRSRRDHSGSGCRSARVPGGRPLLRRLPDKLRRTSLGEVAARRPQ